MSDIVSAWSTTILVGLGLLLLLFLSIALLPRPAPTTTARFYCPWAARWVAVQFLTCETGEPIGLLSCSALTEPDPPGCGRLCVGGEREPGPAERAGGTGVQTG